MSIIGNDDPELSSFIKDFPREYGAKEHLETINSLLHVVHIGYPDLRQLAIEPAIEFMKRSSFNVDGLHREIHVPMDEFIDEESFFYICRGISRDWDKPPEWFSYEVTKALSAFEGVRHVLYHVDPSYYHDGAFRSLPETVIELFATDVETMNLASNSLQRSFERFKLGEHITTEELLNRPFDDSYNTDPRVVREVVKENGFCLRYAREEAKNDPEIVIEAVKHKGIIDDEGKYYHPLMYASEEMKNDIDIVEEAVQNDARALQFAGDNIIDLAGIKEKMINHPEDKSWEQGVKTRITLADIKNEIVSIHMGELEEID